MDNRVLRSNLRPSRVCCTPLQRDRGIVHVRRKFANLSGSKSHILNNRRQIRPLRFQAGGELRRGAHASATSYASACPSLAAEISNTSPGRPSHIRLLSRFILMMAPAMCGLSRGELAGTGRRHEFGAAVRRRPRRSRPSRSCPGRRFVLGRSTRVGGSLRFGSRMLRQNRGPGLRGLHLARIRHVAVVITILGRQELVRVDAGLEPGLARGELLLGRLDRVGSDQPVKHRVAVETKTGASTALARSVSANDRNCSL